MSIATGSGVGVHDHGLDAVRGCRLRSRATTTATGWPGEDRLVAASGSNMRMSPVPRIGRSPAVSTATTPGSRERASDGSIRDPRMGVGAQHQPRVEQPGGAARPPRT